MYEVFISSNFDLITSLSYIYWDSAGKWIISSSPALGVLNVLLIT